ncbi:MAG: hypothetical protein Q9166_004587 [cf. Caloplaca sp. 2 TL-2023]
MSSSNGRPRDKGQKSRFNAAAQEYVSSNSTSAMFLGGHQKSWMSGQTQLAANPHRSPPRPRNGPHSSAVLRERMRNQPTLGTGPGDRNGMTGGSRQVSEYNKSPPAQNSPFSKTSLGNPLSKDSADVVPSVETVLPSPAPSNSDEQRSDNLQGHDSENDAGAFGVHEVPVQASPNPQLVGNGFQGNGQRDCVLRDAGSAMTPPASETMTFHNNQQPISSSNFKVARRTSTEGAHEKKRKRNDSAPSAGNVAVGASHSLSSTGCPSPAGMPSPNWQTPQGAHTSLFVQAVTDRLNEAKERIGQGADTDVARLTLLQCACIQNDHAYLLLHQIYCMDLTSPSVAVQLNTVGFLSEHINALEILTPLLLPNLQHLTKDLIEWFAQFPLPFGVMLRKFQIYREALNSVKTCLAKMTQDWQLYRDFCSKRSYPPLADELVVTLGIESPVLQSVAFRAVLKDLWSGDTDDWSFHECERLFQHNQRAVHLGLMVRSEADKQRHDQFFINKYQNLHMTHIGHRQNADSHSMTQPQSVSSVPSQTWPRFVQGHLTGSQHPFHVRTASEERRAAPPAHINTQFTQVPVTTSLDRTTPIGPSQPIFPNQHSPPVPHSNLRGCPTSPPNPTPFAAPQASQTHRASNNGTPTVISPYSNVSPHFQTFQTRTMSPAGRVGPWSPPTTNLNRSHEVHPSQPIRPLPNPQPVNRATEVPRSGALPPGGHPQLLLPPHGQMLSITAHPNPVLTALHQHKARSPFLTVVDDTGRPLTNTKYFRYVEGVAILEPRLQIGSRQHIEYSFLIDEGDLVLLSGTSEGQNGATSTRTVKIGSRFGRMRCIDATKNQRLASDDNSSWVTANQVWPTHVTVIFNKKPLDIRKKSHYGKDLPIDVTAMIQLGRNQFSVSIIGDQTEDKSEYAIGLETIELTDTAGAKGMTGVLPYSEARRRVMQRFQNADPDIEVVNSSVVMNLCDPYTSRIWDIPMRGRTCRHDQCFDLETFFQTRGSKRPGQPCDPDSFNCPICGEDARPKSLIKDGFFEVLREELASRGRLDAKAITMQQDGTWEVKEEEKTGETGDGSGRRSKNERAASAAMNDGNTLGEREVIELD